YSVEDAKKAVKLGLFSDVILIVATQIALLYTPSAFDYAHDAMKTLFSLNLRISIASAVMYYVANMADIYVFNKLKARTGGKALWMRNNISTILCNCLENFGFIGIAFAGIYDLQTIITISVSTSIIEAIVAACDTPFLYAARRIKGNDAA
ncbi:MAG: queuosine precursor transporter, partial [Oscillospiraceae bacterium]|nr:queuosine precursor transporter [Oscillospiraceae bacterium]